MFSRLFFFFAVWAGLLIPAAGCLAQKGVWDGPDMKKGKQKAVNTKSKVNAWKRQIQRWGMDSSYNHSAALGGRLNSNGWSGTFCYQRRISSGKAHFYQLSFSEVFHEKQIKKETSNAFPELGTGSQYIFGKINNLYMLQLGHGRSFLLLPAVLEGNISIGLRIQAGFSLAMLKPYYLKLIHTDHGGGARSEPYLLEERYSGGNAELFLKPGNILGASGWSKGLNEISCIPGGYGDIAIAIEPVKNKTFFQTITLGINAAFHERKLDIMATQPAYPWQASLYAGLSLGKRWK